MIFLILRFIFLLPNFDWRAFISPASLRSCNPVTSCKADTKPLLSDCKTINFYCWMRVCDRSYWEAVRRFCDFKNFRVWEFWRPQRTQLYPFENGVKVFPWFLKTVPCDGKRQLWSAKDLTLLIRSFTDLSRYNLLLEFYQCIFSISLLTFAKL